MEWDNRARMSTLTYPFNPGVCKGNKFVFDSIQESINENNKVIYFARLLHQLYVLRYNDSPKKIFTQCCRLLSSNGISSKSDNPLVTKLYQEVFQGQKFPVRGNLNIIQYASIMNSTNISVLLNLRHSILSAHIKNTYGFNKSLSNRIAYIVHYKPEENNNENINIGLRCLINREILRAKKFDFETEQGLMEYRKSVIDSMTRNRKRYSLLPIPRISKAFITLDFKTVSYILNSRLPRGDPRREEIKEQNCVSDYFNIPERKGWRIGSTLRTNGTEIQFIYEKNYRYNDTTGRRSRIPGIFPAKEEDYDPPKDYDGQEKLKVHQVAGVDVGHHNMFFSSYYTEKGELKNKRMSKKEWNHRTMRNTVNRKIKRLSSKIKNIETKLVSLKTLDVNQFIYGMKQRLEHYNTIYSCYNNKKLNKLKFAARRARQGAMDYLVEWISNGRTVVPGIGDCSRTTGIKGTSPGGPVQEVRRYLRKKLRSRVFEVNEAYSSKASVCCKGESNIPFKTQEDNKTVHGLLLCQKCRRIWNRDVVGSRNILDIALYRIKGLERPWFYSRLLTSLKDGHSQGRDATPGITSILNRNLYIHLKLEEVLNCAK